MKVLVTGASGFTGSHLLSCLLVNKNLEISGLTYKNIPVDRDEIDWVACNLNNRAQTERAIRRINPERIIHLAGLNQGSLGDLFRTNVFGTDNLLSAVKKLQTDCRILVIGSSAEYGYAGTDPIPESAPLNPVGGYGVSKVAEELLARSYFYRYGIQVAVARPFNLVGPGQSSSFVCGKIVYQLLRIEEGLQESIRVQETVSCRDFIDARDAARAYWSILNNDHFPDGFAGEAFNVGSGTSRSVADILNMISEITGKHYSIEITENHPKPVVPSQKSDNSRITSMTGWRPSIHLKQTLSDMIATTE